MTSEIQLRNNLTNFTDSTSDINISSDVLYTIVTFTQVLCKTVIIFGVKILYSGLKCIEINQTHIWRDMFLLYP